MEVAKHIKDDYDTFLPSIALGLVSSPIGTTITCKESNVIVENTLVDLWKSRYGFLGYLIKISKEVKSKSKQSKIRNIRYM